LRLHVGDAVATTGLTLTQCTQPVQRAPVTPDPYADVPWPDRLHTDQLACRDLNYVSSCDYSFDYLPDGQPAIRFCGAVSIKGSVTLKPGVYILDGGDFTVTAGAALKGDGVTFIRRERHIEAYRERRHQPFGSDQRSVYWPAFLRQPERDRRKSPGHGQLGLEPAGELIHARLVDRVQGNSSTTGACTQIVADRVTFTGNSNIQTSCTSGMKDILIGQTVSIVE
jgi:hypothetical protein